MKKLNLLIVEDEFPIALDLETRLKNNGFHNIEIASCYDEAITSLESQTFNLALLDINLNDKKTGIDIAKYINKNINIPFIFISAYFDASIISEISLTNPAAYLNKPYREIDVLCNISIALNKQKLQNNKSIILRESGNSYKVLLSEIKYAKALDNYTVVYCVDRKITIKKFLKDFLNELDDQFLRIHRSYIVSLTFIDSFTQNTLLVSGEEIPVSSTYKKEFLGRWQ